ncbi:MAG: hypothetical protein PHG82_03460 [Candidatus Gracilibacteria bacterium]|nr:hypothetical protein [Candidatus Gracilibacteria bacterium]
MKEEIKECYIKNKDKLLRGLIYFILVGLFMYFTNSDKKMVTIFFYFQLIILTIYLLFFRLNEFEKYITRHFTMIMLSGIAIIIYFQTKLGIDNKETLLMIGAIIAFWYGYKKYERDKELEIIEKYTIKYNEINNKINSSKSENFEILKNLYSNLISLFYEEYYLKSKGYISDDLWNEWVEWISLDISNIIEFDYSTAMFNIDNKNDKTKQKEYFIIHLLVNYISTTSDRNLNLYQGKQFIYFIFDIINKYSISFELLLNDKNNKLTDKEKKELYLKKDFRKNIVEVGIPYLNISKDINNKII